MLLVILLAVSATVMAGGSGESSSSSDGPVVIKYYTWEDSAHKPLIDAFNIDLKGDDEFYETVCKASLQPVLDGIEYIVSHGRHIEVTTMLIEGMHDEKMVMMLGSLLCERGVSVWHLSRFFPRYRMKDREETSEAFLSSMLTVAKESGIPYIYGGNTMIPALAVCPHCGRVLRDDVSQMLPSVCPGCGEAVYGVFA